MNYMPSIGMLAIYGGRNDNIETNYNQPVLDDLWLLKVETMEYIEVQVAGRIQPQPRFNHCSQVHDKQLIIFGGQKSNFQVSKEILYINLDQDQVERCRVQTEEELMQLET